MTYNVFGGTLNLTQSINRHHHYTQGCVSPRSGCRNYSS